MRREEKPSCSEKGESQEEGRTGDIRQKEGLTEKRVGSSVVLFCVLWYSTDYCFVTLTNQCMMHVNFSCCGYPL